MQHHAQLKRILRLAIPVCLAIGIQLLSYDADAARVRRAKGRAVEIQLQTNDDFVRNDRVTFMKNGKRVGIARISKLKGRRAYARILKGRAPVGADVVLSKGASGSGSGDGLPSSSSMLLGVVAGYSLDSQTVKTTVNGTTEFEAPMTGNGFSLKAFADMEVADQLGLIGRAGIETFNVTGEPTVANACTGNECTVEIMYLAADLLVRYNFMPGTINPYAAAGLGIHFPMSKSSNILDEEKIASTSVFFITGGANIKVSPSMYIPVQVEYGIFPPSNDVSTNLIAVRSGLAWAF